MGNPFENYKTVAPSGANPFDKYGYTPTAKPKPSSGFLGDLESLGDFTAPRDNVHNAQGDLTEPVTGEVITPKAELSEQENDFYKLLGQNASFNYSDEVIAGVRAAMGEDYAQALEDERRQLQETNARASGAQQIGAFAGGLLLPAGPAAKLVQRMAGPGAGLVKSSIAAAPVSGAAGAVSAIGALDDKNAGDMAKAGLAGGITSAIAAPLVGIGVGGLIKGAGQGVGYAGDLVKQAQEHIRNKSGLQYTPLQSTTDYAVRKMGDAAELGGMRTSAALDNGMTRNAVPDTPQALVNSGNDRLVQLADNQAQLLANPNVPRVVNGRNTQTNVWDDLVRSQERTHTGQTQAEGWRSRFFAGHQVPRHSRNPVTLEANRIDDLERSGQQLNNLTATPAGRPYAGTNVPGFVDFATNPQAARIYRQVSQRLGIRGAADHIDPDHIPLLPDDYNREFQRYTDGLRLTAPVALTDGNVPMPIINEMRKQITEMSVAQGPGQQDLGSRLLNLMQQNNAATPPRSRASRFEDIYASRHNTHTEKEDFNTGFNLPSQATGPRVDAVAETRRLPANRQEARRQGMLHGVVEQVNKDADNIGGLNIFENPGVRDAYEEIGQRGGRIGPTAAGVERELRNIGEMQDIGRGLQTRSATRSTDSEGLPAQAARFYVKYTFQPGSAWASVLQQRLGGMSQTRRAEIARLLADTSGEGRTRLMEELARRAHQKNQPYGAGKIATITEIARLLGSETGQRAAGQE